MSRRSRGVALYGGERILLTLWVGCLWSVGYLVAPTLFVELEGQRALAGALAGRMFTLTAYLGLVCGAALWLMEWARGAGRRRQWRLVLLALMLALVAVGEFVLQPAMAALKSASPAATQAAEFGRLHGLASTLFLLVSVAGLALVVSPTLESSVTRERKQS